MGARLRREFLAVVGLAGIAGASCAAVTTDDFPSSDVPDVADGLRADDGAGVDTSGPCPAGLIRCGAECVDPTSDPLNCGGCGRPCSPDESCSGGSCTHACAPDEACNGADDDCDGETDEDFPCAPRATTTCTTSCGTTGTGTCTEDCQRPTGSACALPEESCNGEDDDCDTSCDDRFECCRGQTGACTTPAGADGSHTCGADCFWGDCSAADEACNGTDDDGDTECDEDYSCCRDTTATCSTVCGTTGTRTCSASCTWNPCLAPPETCNGADDDCDAVCDNGQECCRGSTGTCATSCGSTGTRVCSASCTWGSCVAGGETCNGVDDDCDTVCDNGYSCCAGTAASCTTPTGAPGTATCSAGCAMGTCVASGEVCNGLDDDGDTSCDEDFACCAGMTTSCTSGSCTGTATCSASCTLGACNTGAAPTNDTCAGAIPTIASSTTLSFSICAANADYPSTSCYARGPEILYRLDLSSRADVVLETTGSDFDPELHLHSGASCPGPEVACNDDTTGLESRISGTFDAGTYWLMVDGHAESSRGSGTLNVTITPAGAVTNDTCAGAIDITSSSTVTGTTVGATNDHTSSSCGCTPAADVWYRFTLSTRSVVWLLAEHSATGDLSLHLHQDSCTGTIPSGGCNDDSCPRPGDGYNRFPQIAAVLDPATYYLAVDGCAADAFTLHFSASAPGPDAPLGTTNLLLSGGSARTGNTSGGGNDVSPAATCGSTSAPEHVYFFAVCPSASKTVTADTCTGTDYDSYLYAKRDNVQTGTQLACTDDGCGTNDATISFTASGPGIFFIVVDGWTTNSGNYSLAYGGL